EKVTTFQQNLDMLIPGLSGLLLTFLCMYLLKKKYLQSLLSLHSSQSSTR
ncbi:PTS mannose family transporter subunit IID, partial [Mycobacterium tuberculosis]|nr:PTS mannose family transporter subunit IID [Mycobacterium tuberculosis]